MEPSLWSAMSVSHSTLPHNYHPNSSKMVDSSEGYKAFDFEHKERRSKKCHKLLGYLKAMMRAPLLLVSLLVSTNTKDQENDKNVVPYLDKLHHKSLYTNQHDDSL